MWRKSSPLVALALLVAAAFCGSATAMPLGRHLTTQTCKNPHECSKNHPCCPGYYCDPCDKTCKPAPCHNPHECHKNCDCCPGYYCDPHEHTCKPYAACPGQKPNPIYTPPDNSPLYKVCTPGQNNCGEHCPETCAAACAAVGKSVGDVTPDFCKNTGGGNCKGVTAFEANGPCCGCLIKEACV